MKILAKSLSATTLALTISLLLASCGKQDPAPAVEEKAASAEGGEHEEEAAESTVIDKAEADANGIKTASATAGSDPPSRSGVTYRVTVTVRKSVISTLMPNGSPRPTPSRPCAARAAIPAAARPAAHGPADQKTWRRAA